MQNINLLSRIFDEDLRLMSAHFFNSTTYKEYLKSFYSNLNTHYTITLKKDHTGKISTVSHDEIPFHYKNIASYTSNDINLLENNSHKPILHYLQSIFKDDYVVFKNAFIKYSNSDNKDKTHIEVELFIHLPYDAISEPTLAYYYYYKLMSQTRKEMILEMQNLYFDELKTENKRTILIRKYQKKISYYLSELELRFPSLYASSNIEIIPCHKTLESSIQCIHLNLEKMISYMEHCLYDYMDKEQPISYLQRKHYIKQYYFAATELIVLIKLRELPKDIEQSICKPLLAIVNNELKAFSYRKRDYCSTYISVFGALLKKVTSFDHDEIYNLLMALNYNNHNVFKSLEREFSLELEKYNHIKDKQNYLFIKLAKINRIAVTSPFKYHLGLPGLKELLIKFINEMLALYQQQQELTNNEKQKTAKHTIKTAIVKRKVNITVHELALLARLLFECGITPLEGSKQQHFKFIATHYSTKDGEQLSEHNIKNSFYSPKKDSMKTIEKLLISALGKLQKFKNNNAA